jgi:hypothetical protein
MKKRRFKRVDWDSAENMIPLHVAVHEFPFDGRTLAQMTGLTVGQVYYRLHRYGVKLKSRSRSPSQIPS